MEYQLSMKARIPQEILDKIPVHVLRSSLKDSGNSNRN